MKTTLMRHKYTQKAKTNNDSEKKEKERNKDKKKGREKRRIGCKRTKKNKAMSQKKISNFNIILIQIISSRMYFLSLSLFCILLIVNKETRRKKKSRRHGAKDGRKKTGGRDFHFILFSLPAIIRINSCKLICIYLYCHILAMKTRERERARGKERQNKEK